MKNIVEYVRPTYTNGLGLKKVIQYTPTLEVDYYYMWCSEGWVCCDRNTYISMCNVDSRRMQGVAEDFFSRLSLIYFRMKIPHTLNYSTREDWLSSIETFKML